MTRAEALSVAVRSHRGLPVKHEERTEALAVLNREWWASAEESRARALTTAAINQLEKRIRRAPQLGGRWSNPAAMTTVFGQKVAVA